MRLSDTAVSDPVQQHVVCFCGPRRWAVVWSWPDHWQGRLLTRFLETWGNMSSCTEVSGVCNLLSAETIPTGGWRDKSLTRLWWSCCYCSLFFSGVEQVLIWYHSSRFTAACPAAMAARWIRLRVWLLFKHPWFMKGKRLVFPSSCSPKNSCSLSTEYPNHKVGGLTEEDSAGCYISAPPGSRHRYNRDFVGCCLRKGQSITIDLIELETEINVDLEAVAGVLCLALIPQLNQGLDD